MISMDKKYRTRDGLPVRVLCVDKMGTNFPVVALIRETPCCDSELQFTEDGKYLSSLEDHRHDLIEVKPDVVTYTAVYPSGGFGPSAFRLTLSDIDSLAIGLLKTTIPDGGQPAFEFTPKDKL